MGNPFAILAINALGFAQPGGPLETGGSPIGDIVPVARKDLPLSDREMQSVMDRGVLSGQGERCGLDWKTLNFKPLMRYWRGRGKNEEQMAAIAMLHGAGQGSAAAMPCTAENMLKLRSELRFKP